MTVIYVDTLFLLNAIVDYLLLLCSARLAGEPLRRLRFALGAVLGGGYAVAIFLPGLEFLGRPLCRLTWGVLVVLLAFWSSRRLLRQVLIFFALSCAFGGGILAISLLGGRGLTLSGGVLYSSMDLKIVLLSAAGCYGVLTLVFQRVGRHTCPSGELQPVRLSLGERQVELTALVDTGSRMDDVIYEEFKGTGNMEIVLDRKLSERRVFPAIDIPKSSTRREDLLLSPEELEATGILRKALNGLKPEEAVDKILDMFTKTRSNTDFVNVVRKMKIL